MHIHHLSQGVTMRHVTEDATAHLSQSKNLSDERMYEYSCILLSIDMVGIFE